MSFDLGTLDRPFTEPSVNLEASLPEGMTPEEFVELKARLHERLVKEMDPGSLSGLSRDEIDRRFRDPRLRAILTARWGLYGKPHASSAFG